MIIIIICVKFSHTVHLRCQDKIQKTAKTPKSAQKIPLMHRGQWDLLDLRHDHGLLYSGRALAGLCVYVCLCACSALGHVG